MATMPVVSTSVRSAAACACVSSAKPVMIASQVAPASVTERVSVRSSQLKPVTSSFAASASASSTRSPDGSHVVPFHLRTSVATMPVVSTSVRSAAAWPWAAAAFSVSSSAIADWTSVAATSPVAEEATCAAV